MLNNTKRSGIEQAYERTVYGCLVRPWDAPIMQLRAKRARLLRAAAYRRERA